MDAAAAPWWEAELAGCTFADARLGQRLRKLVRRRAVDVALGRQMEHHVRPEGFEQGPPSSAVGDIGRSKA